MRVHKKVISTRTDDFLLCGFDDCDRDGYELYKVEVQNIKPHMRPYTPQGEWFIRYVFCSEGHKQMFIDSVRHNQGRLAPGNKSMSRYA
jgi:hypothetical protein